MLKLSSEQARIFRIVHVANIPWILTHGGLHCQNASEQDPNYVNIGNTDLIGKRAGRVVPIAPGGTLSDYVPFYFTPFSIMMYNIKTGYGGVTRRSSEDIVILSSSIHRLRRQGVPFLYTNQHAYPVDTDFYAEAGNLEQIDWALLDRHDFKTSDADPGKQRRYQAEALVHQHIPLDALSGIGCYNDAVKEVLEAEIAARGLELKVRATPDWYFR